MLVTHATEDRILPLSVTAARLPGLVKDINLISAEGGSHNIGWTHPNELNKAFLADQPSSRAGEAPELVRRRRRRPRHQPRR
ncbi:hypothetical protein ACFVFJ_45920 [Streptomyces sp. NPDC057717]|uniref:hypothetical protein n=1 Tax=Streptomyces sp. NPDC057717 TaxID=3346224 RepID=UPI00368E4F4E